MDTAYISFIKENRLKLGLTQEDLAAKAGVGLRFIRELEQGKETIQLSKVNQVLSLFGVNLIPGNELDGFKIFKENLKRLVEIQVRNGPSVSGVLKDCTFRDNKIYAWILEETEVSETAKRLTTIVHQDIAAIKNL